jgi:hypothetical protein
MPSQPDHHGADWVSTQSYDFQQGARRFEYWEHNHAAWLGLGVAVDQALEWGTDRIALQAALAPSWFGFLPVLWAFAAALVAGWLGAWIGPAPADADVQRAFSSAESHRGPSWEQPAARGTIPGSS